MSVEDRLRSGLAREAEAIDAGIEATLEQVVARGRRRRALRAAGWGTAGVAAAAAVALVVSLAVDNRRSPVQPAQPDGLLGTYVVRVPESATAEESGIAGRWVVSLKADGSFALVPPRGFSESVSGASYRTEGDQLTTDAFVGLPGCQVTTRQLGIYVFERSPVGLSFRVVTDDCPGRALFFAQPWKERP